MRIFLAALLFVPLVALSASRAERVAARTGQWYERMDFGPAISSTVKIGDEYVLKGLVVRLGDETHSVLYDTEMLSMNAAWKGFLNFNGTPWDGRHGGNPSPGSTPDFAGALGSGWAKAGYFADTRTEDFGPLPREHAKYRGHYRHGDDVVLVYSVGETEILELPSLENGSYARSFNIAESATPLTLRVTNAPGAPIGLLGTEVKGDGPESVTLNPGVNVITDRTDGGWDMLAMGAPSTDDATRHVRTLAGKAHKKAGADKALLPRLHDGKASADDDTANSTWFDGDDYAFMVDLGAAKDVARINSFSWHKSDRSPQKFTLAGSLDKETWTEIAKVDSTALGKGGKHGSSVLKGEGSLGNFRYLRWSARGNNHGCFFTEVDVFSLDQNLPAIRKSGGSVKSLSVGLVAGNSGAKLRSPQAGVVLLDIPAGKNLAFKVLLGERVDVAESPAPCELRSLTKGGPRQWAGDIRVSAQPMPPSSGPYVTDDIPLPEENPWQANIRFGGFDFFADGTRAAACTWNGDVWIVSGLGEESLSSVSWKRYAAGLFETIGLRIVGDVVYVTGKDQITRLHDLNGDGEADFYECFNNDIMITDNFHEFTFGLQTDPEGNFYFAKGSPVNRGGRGFSRTHAHHGSIFRVSKDGSSSEVWANGLRAPNGLAVGPNGEVTAGENEGTFVPACKINWMPKGSFAGVCHPGNGRSFEQGYDAPLCWLPMNVDNSGGGQVWTPDARWGLPAGQLLHLSYGRSTVYRAFIQETSDRPQGGVTKLPIKLVSSAMRARFNPKDGQLYVIGFRGWQTNAARACGFQRIRYVGKPIPAPSGLSVSDKGVTLRFDHALDKELAEDLESYDLRMWQYVWGPMYGSGHFSVVNPDEKFLAEALTRESKAGGTRGANVTASKFLGDPLTVSSATLAADGKSVFLAVPDIRPVMQMKIAMDLETTAGDEIITNIYNTIHELPKAQ
ncbi:MAG: hypothetical protein ACI8W8_004596 [Rhodothermales bacterium]|jgi:hypothetical protein